MSGPAAVSDSLPDPREHRLRLERTGEPETIAVSVGPTYLLHLELPEGDPGELEAAIVERHRATPSRRYELEPVSMTPRPFVRFPRRELAEAGEPCILELGSADGAWVGRAEVPWVDGVHEAVVRLELGRAAELIGVVSDESGRALPGIGVQLQELGGGRTRSRESDEAGRYAFELLEPGPYVLYVRDDHFHPWKRSLGLPPGSSRQDLALRSRPEGGAIRGTITSSTGSFDGMTFLFLEGMADQDVWRRYDVRWTDVGGRLVGSFAFPDLGHGEYRLTCNTLEGVSIPDRVRFLTPPADGVHFHLRDDVPSIPLSVRVVDARTGAPVDAYRFLSRVEGGYLDDQPVEATAPSARAFREGVDSEWWIHAPGYRPAAGTASDVGGDGELLVELEPGFGAIVHAISIHSLSSLAGVAVFADGVEVGRTDAQGDLVVDLPAAPAALGFDPTRWRVYADGTYRSDIDGDGAYRVDDGPHLAAYLRRVE